MIPRRLLDRLPNKAKLLLVLLALYLFLIGIGSMGSAFKMMGGGFTTDLLGSGTSPLIALFIGILATTLVQSSSTTTSVVVGLVFAGAVDLEIAIYMVMGANVGTTVTNTIVSLGHITRSNEYKRAFAAATVHDFFNIIVLLILFPLEVFTHFLKNASAHAASAFQDVGGTALANPIKLVTKPAITALKDFCTWTGLDGGLLLTIAILFTFIALITLVKVLRSLMVEKLENLFDRVIFRSPYRALFFGVVLTVLVQSSSITTSIAIPLVGAGILTIRQIMPYTMGANIGTTITSLLAALAGIAAAKGGDGDFAKAMLGLHLAFFHVLFNVVGVIMVWPFRWIPILIAENFARLVMWNRMIPGVYIILTFYILPILVVWRGR